jgi:hypothetical protein
MSRILIANPPLCLIEEKPLQTQNRPDHVHADSFCFPLGLRIDLTVDVESGVASGEDFLHKLATDEFSTEKQRKDPPGEQFLDKAITEV